jgi:hypothetical protein
MTTNHRAVNLLATFLAGCGLVACTTQEAKTGTGGAGGGSLSGVGGSATGAGGGSAYATSEGVACPAPAQMITDFTYDPDSGATDQVRFGTVGTTLSGGEDAYGSLTSNVTGSDWEITGTVADFSGFNLYFDVGTNNCNKFDASAFSGITFTVWGTTGTTGGTSNPVTLGMSTLDDAVAYGWLDSKDAGPAMPSPGTCTPTSGNGPYYHPGCADPVYTFSVTGTQASPQTVTAKWSDFTMGLPMPGVTPTGILSVYWNVPWSTGATSYAVDIHIDNLAFTPK